MNREQFWNLIDEARDGAEQPDPDGIAATVTAALGALPPEEICQAHQVLWDLLAESYRGDLWGAAYLINGGASDDGFEYFRCWLISQGRTVFERALADPDSLAEVPAVITAAARGEDLDGEPMLTIAWTAYQRKTGENLPADAVTISYPPIAFTWNFDNGQERRHHLPRLSSLYLG